MDTLLDLLAASRSVLRDDDGEAYALPSLVDDGCRIGAWLLDRGVQPTDRVAIRMRNRIDYVRLLAGCAANGSIAVSVNTRFSDDEVSELVARSGARLVVEELGDGWRACPPLEPVGTADDGYVVFTTSGTTSRPKMVLHTQRSTVDHARDVAAGLPLGSGDVVMVAMPLCGTFGLTSLTGAIAGDCRIVLTDFDPARTARLIEDERVGVVNGSDDMFHRLLERRADLRSLELGGYARFNSSLDGIVARAERAGATLTGLYGMSEVQALFSRRDPSGDAAERSRAGGTVMSPRASYRVVDGELQLRGPSLFAGYLAEGGHRIDEELTAAHFDDGWFCTGDLAEPESDRTFEYVDRIGDALRLGGFLVSPREIEAVLLDVEGVGAAQVVAVDRPGGARPVAFVIGHEGAPVDEELAIAACRDRLARYKVPVRVVTLDAFPTTPSANGTKVQRVELRRRAAAELAG